jgi:hypothetical protein
MIEPSPTLFYQILVETFGRNAIFGTRAVTKIKLVDKDHPYCESLCIDKGGVVLINKFFWRKHIKTKEDAKIVLIHELFHAILGDHLKLDSNMSEYDHYIANIAMDMRINAAIIQAFQGNHYWGNNVLTKLYPKYGVMGLLRPGSAYGSKNKFRLLYSSLYSGSGYHVQEAGDEVRVKNIFKNEESIRATLKILLPKPKFAKSKAIFLGYHGGNDEAESKESVEGASSEAEEFTGLGEDLKDEIRQAIVGELSEQIAHLPGIGKHSFENIVNVIRSSRSLNMKALEKYACSAKINKMKAFYSRPRRVSSVYPEKPSHRDMSLLAAGHIPILWRNHKNHNSSINKNVAIYLDVSGSVGTELPRILGVIAAMRQNITTVFCFSNEVHKHSIAEISSGQYTTTGGTDFDCIIEHAVENRIDKIIVFTDGYANCSSENKELSGKQIKDMAIVYFGGHTKNNFFDEKYGNSFKIEELV